MRSRPAPPACHPCGNRGSCAARGQLSLELLAAFAIFLSLLAISYLASMRLASATETRLEIGLANSSFARFTSALDRACSLGDGNVRAVEISGEPASVSSEGGLLIFTAGNFSAQASPACPISIIQANPARNFRVENKDGTLQIS